MYALKYFAGNIKCQGGERGGEQGVGEEEEDEEGGILSFLLFFSVNTFFPVNTLFYLIFFCK